MRAVKGTVVLRVYPNANQCRMPKNAVLLVARNKEKEGIPDALSRSLNSAPVLQRPPETHAGGINGSHHDVGEPDHQHSHNSKRQKYAEFILEQGGLADDAPEKWYEP